MYRFPRLTNGKHVFGKRCEHVAIFLGHVLRCVSAGLAASLISFVRQACLITHHKKGDWDECFNDEEDDKNVSQLRERERELGGRGSERGTI